MSKFTEQDSGIAGGTMDAPVDTVVSEPNNVIDQFLARRHQAEERGKQAAQRIRAQAKKSSGSKIPGR